MFYMAAIAVFEPMPTDTCSTAIEVAARRLTHEHYAASGLAASASRAEGRCRRLFMKHKMKHKRSISEV